jgi:hypothetical protein
MGASSEVDVRRIIEEVNEEIRQLNRLSVQGPPTTLMPFDVEEVVEAWRRRPRQSEPLGERPDEPVSPERPRRTIRGAVRRVLGRPDVPDR